MWGQRAEGVEPQGRNRPPACYGQRSYTEASEPCPQGKAELPPGPMSTYPPASRRSFMLKRTGRPFETCGRHMSSGRNNGSGHRSDAFALMRGCYPFLCSAYERIRHRHSVASHRSHACPRPGYAPLCRVLVRHSLCRIGHRHSRADQGRRGQADRRRRCRDEGGDGHRGSSCDPAHRG